MQYNGDNQGEKEARKHRMDTNKFKERFRDLYDKSGCKSISQFANLLEMNRQNVDRYYNDDRFPDLPSLYQICMKMNVSADWLLGITDVSKPSPELRSVCEFTALSEEAVKKVLWLSEYDQMNSLSYMMELSSFESMILKFSRFLEIVKMIKAEDLDIAKLPVELQNGKVILSLNESVSFFKQEVKSGVDDLCNEAYTRHLAKISDYKFPVEIRFDREGKMFTKKKEESEDEEK